MRDCKVEVYNVFDIKQDDASLFVVNVLKIVQSNGEKLLTPPLRNIGAIQLSLMESRSSYWTIEVNVEKQPPFVKLMKSKMGRNTTACIAL